MGNYISCSGQTKRLSDWARCVGLKYNTLYNRVYYLKWSTHESIYTPPNTKNNRKVAPNKKFDFWTVMSFSHRVKRMPYWKCKCVCGKIKVIPHSNLISKRSRSCGCQNLELISRRLKRNKYLWSI